MDVPKIFRSRDDLVRILERVKVCHEPGCTIMHVHHVMSVTCYCGEKYLYQNATDVPLTSSECSSCKTGLIIYLTDYVMRETV